MSTQSSPPLTLQFNLGRIPVMVEPSFWLVAALLGMAIRDMKLLLLWVAVVFVSVLVHELGHAVAAMAMGSGAAIRLYSFGGLCYHQPLGRWQGVVVSLAGPFAGFLFGGLTYVVSRVWPPTSPLGAYLYEFLWFANIYWGLINLLPVPPLDGGHVALGVLGPTRRRMALLLGVIAAGAVVAWALSERRIYLTALFAWMGFQCYQAFSAAEDLKPQKPVEPEPEALSRGWQALRSGNESEAARLGHLALAAARPGEESNAARDLLAWVSLAEGNARMALSHLEKVDPPQAARPFSLAMAYEAMGLPDRALP
ncbi:MAG TPA: site-2 protease family protein, partial [Myxococcaceae bacterium]|nr:site-2 protease family protein [Myxococcaceae bacterium]